MESKEKPIRPTLRGEIWELADGQNVTFVALLRVVPKVGRLYAVFGHTGALEAVYERQFVRRINPPVPEDSDGVDAKRDAGRRGNDGY